MIERGKDREIHYNIGQLKNGFNRLNSVHKAIECVWRLSKNRKRKSKAQLQ